jgi:hypothetical protein
MLRPAWVPSFGFALLLFLSGCGGGDPIQPNEALALLVGDWDADRFVVTNKSTSTQSAELIRDLGASFSLNVQPSGQYTAILVYQGTPLTEIGLLETSGSEIIFHVSIPEPDLSRSRFSVTAARLTLDGDTEFDFNLDGRADPATAHIELKRR